MYVFADVIFLNALLSPKSSEMTICSKMNEEQGKELYVYEQKNECGLERRRDLLKGHLRTQHESLIQNQSCYITTKITCQILSSGDPSNEIASVSK
jgi:hypothetical protein